MSRSTTRGDSGQEYSIRLRSQPMRQSARPWAFSLFGDTMRKQPVSSHTNRLRLARSRSPWGARILLPPPRRRFPCSPWIVVIGVLGVAFLSVLLPVMGRLFPAAIVHQSCDAPRPVEKSRSDRRHPGGNDLGFRQAGDCE